MSLKMNSADFGDSLDAYDGFGIIVTDNDDMEVDTSAIPTDYDLGLKLNSLDFGDSLLAYDGYGITVTDNDDFEVDTSAIPTDYDIGLKLNSLDFGDSLAAYDGFGVTVTDNDDFEVDTSAIPTDYDLGLKLAIADSGSAYVSVYTDGLKLLASSFGDSLYAYDGFGITITDNIDMAVDTSAIPTDYDVSLKLNSTDFQDSMEVYIVGTISDTTTIDSAVVTQIARSGVTTLTVKHSLVDAGAWTAPTGVAGYGYVMIGDNVEYAQFDFKADGTVHLQFNSANVGNVGAVDAKLNIYDAGGGIAVENQLGSTLNTIIMLNYITP
jgi:hypothetical protein